MFQIYLKVFATSNELETLNDAHFKTKCKEQFVDFLKESDAEAALNLNGVKLNGRSINFRKACVAFVEEVETRVYSPHGRRSPQYSREAPPRYDRGTGGQRDRDRDRDSREPRKNSTKDTDIRDEQQQKDVKSRSSVDENVKSRFEKEKVLDEKKERPREKVYFLFSLLIHLL